MEMKWWKLRDFNFLGENQLGKKRTTGKRENFGGVKSRDLSPK